MTAAAVIRHALTWARVTALKGAILLVVCLWRDGDRPILTAWAGLDD